jgi:hypothetical protein
MMSSNQVYFQINSMVARNLYAKFGMHGTVPEFLKIFSSSKHHPKRPPWRHRWCYRTKFILKLSPWRQGYISYDFFKQKPPSRAAAVTSSSMTWHRAYPQNNFSVGRNLHAKFGADRTVSEFSTSFSSKIRRPARPPWCHRRWRHIATTRRTISGWRVTSTPSLARIGQFLNFLRFFFKQNPRFYQVAVTSSFTSRLPAERFRGGEEPPCQVWRGSDSFCIFYDF